MDIVLGVGIPVAILVAIVLCVHIYKWIRNTLEGGLLAGTLYAVLTHHTRKQKLNASLAKVGKVLSKVKFSTEALEEKRVLKTVANSTKAVRNAEEAVRIASNAYNKASTAARTLRKSKATRGGPITIEIQQAEENAERAVTEATRAYITASEAQTRASVLHRKAENNEDFLHEEYARKRLHDKKKEVLYNPDEVFLRKDRRKGNRKSRRKQKRI